MLHFNIITLFPDFFASPLKTGLMAKAVSAGLISFSFYNPRDFSANKHRHVDDRPFGGGPGMVLEVGPLFCALKAIANPGKIINLTPAGYPFAQEKAGSLVKEENITLICGRYEGIDARLSDFFALDDISVVNAVLNGGEAAAINIIEAVSRLLPGFLGKDESGHADSFSDGLLEYPQYTRPEAFRGVGVPKILLGGNHAQIAAFRRCQSLEKTLRIRPDLLAKAPITENDANILKGLPRHRPGRNLFFCLFHYPVYLDKRATGASSLTNLDIHDIARISHSYGMGPFFVLTPLQDQLDLARTIIRHWRYGEHGNKDRRNAFSHVEAVCDFSWLERKAEEFYGQRPEYVIASARWPMSAEPPLTAIDVLEICRSKPVCICLGTAQGLDIEALDFPGRFIRPIRFLDENHLSVRSAAAILADRILGDFY